jgi:hypothetical protein
MQHIKKDEATLARRRLLMYLLSDTDGKTPVTGIDLSGSEIRVSKNGAAAADFTGLWSEMEFGEYAYELGTSEIDTFGFVAVRAARSGSFRTFLKEAQIVASDPYVVNGVQKNTAYSNFTFGMYDSNSDLKSGETVTVQRAIDSGAFADATNTPATEIGSTGVYRIDLSASDLNGDSINIKATSGAAKSLDITIKTTQ